jgi:hypothetical protein
MPCYDFGEGLLSKESHMRITLASITALLLFSALPASAGYKAAYYSGLVQTSEGSGSGTFSGQLGTARNYPGAGIEFLTCSVSYYNGHPANAPLVYCAAKSSDGRYLSCSTWSNQFAAVLASVNSDSYITVNANKNSYSGTDMTCTSIKVENASYYEPKLP